MSILQIILAILQLLVGAAILVFMMRMYIPGMAERILKSYRDASTAKNLLNGALLGAGLMLLIGGGGEFGKYLLSVIEGTSNSDAPVSGSGILPVLLRSIASSLVAVLVLLITVSATRALRIGRQ